MRLQVDARIPPGKVLRYLVATTLGLCAAHLTVSLAYLYMWKTNAAMSPRAFQIFALTSNFFDLRSETAIATWYSCALLLGCALLLLYIRNATRQDANAPRALWSVLFAVLLVFSIDEIAGFHEYAEEVLKELYDVGGLFEHAWVIPASVLVAIGYPAFVGSTTRIPGRFRRLFLLGGGLFFLGALGMEFVDGYFHILYEDHETLEFFPIKVAYITIEETTELLGVNVFLYGLLRYIEAGCPAAARDSAARRSQPAA